MRKGSNELRSQKYTIKWRNLMLTTKQEKVILNNLNGCVQSGEFMSIMGPSGAGKSSLLSIITGRLNKSKSQLTLQGDTLFNGEQYNLRSFSKHSAYVQQDDLLYGTLTVKETFFFQAKLKLWNLSSEQQQKKCEQLIKKLNLSECANVLIGNNQFKKSISGGQKKRVSIGVELISQPQILVFDEPTSGLDSHNALIITRLLVNLAKNQNKLIIATIHQPSSLIFQSMDKLYLLKSGECIYYGQAKEVVKYMADLGIAVDYRMNPADFFMLEISAMKEEKGYQTPLNSENFSNKCVLPQQFYIQKSNEVKEVGQLPETQAPFLYQFKPLLVRSFLNFIRLPSNQLNKIVTAVMIPAILGIIYLNIGNQVPEEFSQQYMMNLICFIFMGVYFVFAMNTFDTTLAFPSEKEHVFKDAAAGLYSLTAYYISRLLAEVVGSLLPGLICSIALYLLSGLDLEDGHFAIFIMVFVIMSFEGYLFGLFFGVLVKDQTAAVTFLPMALIPMLLVSGLVVNISDIPVFIRWLQYLSPIRHSLLILFQDQLQSQKFKEYWPLNLPDAYGLGDSSQLAWVYLFGLLVLYFCLSVLILFVVKKTL